MAPILGMHCAIFSKVQRQKAIVFLISDFMDPHYKDPLRLASKRHDIVPIVLEDPKELSLPKSGLIAAEDSETGQVVFINTYSPEVRGKFRNMGLAKQMNAAATLGPWGCPASTSILRKAILSRCFGILKKAICDETSFIFHVLDHTWSANSGISVPPYCHPKYRQYRGPHLVHIAYFYQYG